MARWLVRIRIMTEETREVEADTSEQATQKAMAGDFVSSSSKVLGKEFVDYMLAPDAKWSMVETNPSDPISLV